MEHEYSSSNGDSDSEDKVADEWYTAAVSAGLIDDPEESLKNKIVDCLSSISEEKRKQAEAINAERVALEKLKELVQNTPMCLLNNIFANHVQDFNKGKKQNSVGAKRIIIDGKRMYDCPECDFQRASRPAVQAHIMDKHSHGEVLRCGLCDFETKNYESLKHHCSNMH